MRVVVRKEPVSALSDYGSVSIAFSTTTVLEVEWVANGLGGVRMAEAPLRQPFTKDFDAHEPVTRWHRLGDISHWGVFAAFIDDTRVGGAVVAPRYARRSHAGGAQGPRGSVGHPGASRLSPPRSGQAPAGSSGRLCARVRLLGSKGRSAEHEPGRLSFLCQERLSARWPAPRRL